MKMILKTFETGKIAEYCRFFVTLDNESKKNQKNVPKAYLNFFTLQT